MRVTVRTLVAAAGAVAFLSAVVAVVAADPPNLKPIGRLPGGGGEAPGQRIKPGVANEPPMFRLPPDELIPEAVGLVADAGQTTDWGHAKINVPQAWGKTKGEGAVVAVLDTGIDSNHADLKDQVIGFKNFTNSNTPIDVQGHGTHCAGIVAALDNDLGTVGVAPQAKLLNGKVLGDNGSGQMNWSAQGVDWAVEQGAHVISMSLGAPGPFPDLEEAIKRAVNKGVIVICAASNSGPNPNTVEWPGKYQEVVCVAAFDKELNIANFSSRGPEVDVAAPGVSVLSLRPGGQVATLSGTSMATPYVAGVAALYVSACKKAGKTPTPTEFRKILEESSQTNNPQRPNPNSGYGRIVADKYVGSVGTDTTPGGEVVFTQSDFSSEGWAKMQKAGLDKLTLGLKGTQPQTTPAKAPTGGGSTPAQASGKVPS